MRKAVFIDKDGTLVKDVPYNAVTSLIELQPQAGAALRRLKETGFLLILVTNQAGIGYGYFREIMLVGVFNHINALLREEGISLDDFYYCPHHPQAVLKKYRMHCDCRKPQAGMLLQAADKYDLVLENSWMVGDILNDVEAGNRAGCHTILLDNGHETEWEPGPFRTPGFTAATWTDVSDIILQQINNPDYERIT